MDALGVKIRSSAAGLAIAAAVYQFRSGDLEKFADLSGRTIDPLRRIRRRRGAVLVPELPGPSRRGRAGDPRSGWRFALRPYPLRGLAGEQAGRSAPADDPAGGEAGRAARASGRRGHRRGRREHPARGARSGVRRSRAAARRLYVQHALGAARLQAGRACRTARRGGSRRGRRAGRDLPRLSPRALHPRARLAVRGGQFHGTRRREHGARPPRPLQAAQDHAGRRHHPRPTRPT